MIVFPFHICYDVWVIGNLKKNQYKDEEVSQVNF